MKKTRTTFFTLFAILTAVLLSGQNALANTAANTKIINKADLSYNDGSGTKHASAEVTVIVSLKSAPPTVTQMTSYSGPYGTSLDDQFLLINNSNGPETFSFTTATSNPVNGGVVVSAIANITLGATVTIAGSGTNGSNAGWTDLWVPSDGVIDASVNGIVVGDTIVINGAARIVQAITDNASGHSVITVTTVAIPGAGVVIGEQATVHAAVNPAGSAVLTANCSGDVKLTATSTNDATATATSPGVDGNTFYPVSATLLKYVRNVTTASGAGANKITMNYGAGNVEYFREPFTTEVKAKPGEVLEYLLFASNGAAAPVTQVVLTDLIPADYVTLKSNAYGTKAFRYFADATLTVAGTNNIDYSDTVGDDAVDYNASFDTTVGAKKGKITAWIGGAAPVYNTSGTIAGNKSIILLYQVTVQ